MLHDRLEELVLVLAIKRWLKTTKSQERVQINVVRTRVR